MNGDAETIRKLEKILNTFDPELEVRKFLLSEAGKIYFNTKQAAKFINASTTYLEHDRLKKSANQIPYTKLGKKKVVYRLLDLVGYMEGRSECSVEV